MTNWQRNPHGTYLLFDGDRCLARIISHKEPHKSRVACMQLEGLGGHHIYQTLKQAKEAWDKFS